MSARQFERTIDVYRVEHVRNCSGQRGHGPFIRRGCYAGSVPNFGMAGRKPSLRSVHELCAVTKRQARYWWSDREYSCGEIEQWTADGWEFVHYRVSGKYSREDCGQVVFDVRRAKRVGSIGFPRWLMTDRRTTYDSRYRFHDRHAGVTRELVTS